MNKKIGLNDYDRVLVTVALWISAISLFATALTLPMLPDRVTIFYHPSDTNTDFYSKYNNLLSVIASLIPATIITVTALLKSRNRLQNNFLSIMLFSIMLSLCMGSVIIYGITEQFDASNRVKSINLHGLIAIVASLILSMLSALLSLMLNAPKYANGNNGNKKEHRFIGTAAHYWQIGAIGFLLCAIISTLTPGYYCYIPLGAGLIVYIVTVIILAKKRARRMPEPQTCETAQYKDKVVE